MNQSLGNHKHFGNKEDRFFFAKGLLDWVRGFFLIGTWSMVSPIYKILNKYLVYFYLTEPEQQNVVEGAQWTSSSEAYWKDRQTDRQAGGQAIPDIERCENKFICPLYEKKVCELRSGFGIKLSVSLWHSIALNMVF